LEGKQRLGRRKTREEDDPTDKKEKEKGQVKKTSKRTATVKKPGTWEGEKEPTKKKNREKKGKKKSGKKIKVG